MHYSHILSNRMLAIIKNHIVTIEITSIFTSVTLPLVDFYIQTCLATVST